MVTRRGAEVRGEELSAPQEASPGKRFAWRAGFNDLYQEEYEPMVRLARGLVDLPETAEEIVQEAFVKVFDRWSRLDNPGGYLRSTVVNSARSELRKRRTRRRAGPRLFNNPDSVEEQDYLLDALNLLSPRQKTALVLRFYAGMSEKEIARTMGVRPGTVKSATSRGLAELRKVIER
ncbi:SigE family RNA polymerase sigma factor [Candidatus Poriferisocius sp.]|uniref:SigE family RNA polymerase sigma factor n=1 Tax=Candidatus Poriferisocius sp. TaxID=3101276 RepID=UPI003B01C09C